MPKTPPQKPYPDFPLFPHRSGQWAKTIKGRHYYFGVWDNPQAALERYVAERDDLYAGRTPSRGEGLSVVDLVNEFLTRRQKQVDRNELTQAEFDKYHAMAARVVRIFGRTTHVANLRPTDFQKLRDDFARTHSNVTLCGDIARTRKLFNYCADTHDIRVKFGDEFKKPDRKTLRRENAQKPKRFFNAEQLRAIIKAADVQLRAMILLGLNCGFGNDDCAKLSEKHLDLNGKWVALPRGKTGVERRCPLWIETVKAIQIAIELRPVAKQRADANRVFITKFGASWEPKSTKDSPISNEMGKLLERLSMREKGVNFYALRHVFESIGRMTRDRDAVDYLMGHIAPANDMSAVYNELVPDDGRLKAVTGHIRKWLLSKSKKT